MKQIFISEGKNNVVKELLLGLGRSSIIEIKDILPVLGKISVDFAISFIYSFTSCHRESHTETTMTVCTHCR